MATLNHPSAGLAIPRVALTVCGSGQEEYRVLNPNTARTQQELYLLRTLVEQSQMEIAAFDHRLRFVEAGARWFRATGRSQREYITGRAPVARD